MQKKREDKKSKKRKRQQTKQSPKQKEKIVNDEEVKKLEKQKEEKKKDEVIEEEEEEMNDVNKEDVNNEDESEEESNDDEEETKEEEDESLLAPVAKKTDTSNIEEDSDESDAVEVLDDNFDVDDEEDDDEEPEQPERNRCVVIRHLPNGFYEKQLKEFFSQFAVVEKVRVLRNPKTGKPRGVAFILFRDVGAAEVICEHLDYYKLNNKVLRIEMSSIPLESQKKMFNPMFNEYQHIPYDIKKLNAEDRVIENFARKRRRLSKQEYEEAIKRDKEACLEKQKKWQSLGIDYTFWEE